MLQTAAGCVHCIHRVLADPTEFVRRVLDNMTGYHQECQVRLVIDSAPARPDYGVEMLFEDEVDGERVDIPQPMTVVPGRTHAAVLAIDVPESGHWSSEAMTFAEVQQLLGELRGFQNEPDKLSGSGTLAYNRVEYRPRRGAHKSCV